nr:hypothetical protein [Tanacetum cinerariifolium]
MSNQSEDIQAAGSDTHPPMLDKTDFESGDRTWFKETMLGVLLLQEMRELRTELPKRPQMSNYFKEKMLLMQAQENGVDLDDEQLLFLAGEQTNTFYDDVDEGPIHDMAQKGDNIFQADQCDAFDSDVDEAPTAQTLFMANLSSTNPVYDEVGPSYDSDTLSKVQDHANYLNNMNGYHKEHEMQINGQPNDVVDSDTEYTSNSNIISYEQYVEDNEEQVVQIHDSEDTLEIVEATRKQIIEKMKDPICVKKKVKITPHDYSKENYLATFCGIFVNWGLVYKTRLL